MSLLAIEKVGFQFPDAERAALMDFSCEIQPGDFIILLGSNGSGKSTLLQLIRRAILPCRGQLKLENQNINDYSLKSYSQKVNLLTQNCCESLFNSMTIYENYLLMKDNVFGRIHHRTEREFLVNYLLDFNPNLSSKIDNLCSQLSGGEKQALALSFCLLHPPQLLLLDEHTSALDPKTSEQIMQLTDRKIKEHHITCMLTTHDLDLALKYGNRIIVLADGALHATFTQPQKQQLCKSSLLANCF